MTYRKKLIEVALPLEEINKQSSREKSIRHGHPSTLHLWWARRPLAACRAVLFASLVDDPGEYLPEKEAEVERQRLFRLIEQLVNWDNVNNEKLLAQARLEIARSVARSLGMEAPIGEAAIREFLAEKAPAALDPFCGGGSIPLEAQRLGLRAYASDLNPVAVLITKALIEIPPKFANRPPVHPPEKDGQAQFNREWRGATGLAEDVRYYGKWMRDEAEKRIGHLYPKVKLPKEHGGGEATVIAWLWARTVKCPNPACGAMMPLVRSFWLSTKKDKKAWVKPVVDRTSKAVRFQVKSEGTPPEGTVNRRGAKCICCETSVPFDYIRAEGKAGRIGAQLMAIISEEKKTRVYLAPSAEHEMVAAQSKPKNVPDTNLPDKALSFRVQLYGMLKHRDLFTSRQLVALTTFSDLVSEARWQVRRDAVTAGLANDGVSLNNGGASAQAYAEAVATYLAFALDKCADYWNTIATWMPRGTVGHAFSKQALPMTWDYVEAAPFADFHCAWHEAFEWVAKQVSDAPEYVIPGNIKQADVINLDSDGTNLIVSTDPPYYDNIGYADLSDFFYVWLRHSLSKIYPNLFSTVLVPKTQELVATPYRFDGSKEKAQLFFEEGLGKAFERMRDVQHDNYPLTVYYAFKQSESGEDADESENEESPVASTGWETMLEGLIKSRFSVTGTWPMRSERSARSVALGTNALASSIVLVCRSRPENASPTTRREFLNALKRELPPALKQLQQGAIAPVDLAQAAIGPGMAVFSRYSKVLEADGTPMRVRTALALINQALDEFLAEQEGEFDSDTRWVLAWFEQFGHNEGPFGVAETLSKAKNTSIDGLVRAGVLQARAGKVRLLKREEFDANWTPERDSNHTLWEATQYLIRALDSKGEEAAANLLRRLRSTGEVARDLAYRLYSICERKGWAQEALAYNMLATAWPRLTELAGQIKLEQGKLNI